MRHYQNPNGRMVDPGILIYGAYVYAAKRTDPAAASHVAPVSVWMRQPIVTGAAGRAAAAVDAA